MVNQNYEQFVTETKTRMTNQALKQAKIDKEYEAVKNEIKEKIKHKSITDFVTEKILIPGVIIMLIILLYVQAPHIADAVKGSLYASGYKQGIQHAKLYHKASGMWPTQQWIDANYKNEFLEEVEIIDSEHFLGF